MVNTKTAPRRELSFGSIDELGAELDRLEAAGAAGNLGHTGNWTPGEILDHLANFWTCTLDGFPPGKVPMPIRLLAQVLFKKKAVTGSPPPPGFKIPAKMDGAFSPREGVTFEQGMEALRTCIMRTQNGDAYTPASPLFGKLTRDEWIRINLGHCAMHLSFVSINQ